MPKNKTFTIVTVGRLTMPKKIDRVIRLAARLKKEKYAVAFQIIGDGELKNELQQLTIDLNVTDCVAFLGFLKNPYPYINNATIYVQPSRFEGKSLAIDEAKILHKPILTTNFTSAKDQIESGINGLIVPLNEESIADGIIELIENTALRNSFVSNLKKHHYGTESEIKKLYQIIDN